MNFSLVSTVFNESKRLSQTIDDLRNQTLQPDEIIITDAGSTDGTLEILNNWKLESEIPIIILVKKRCNVAEGRNLAIKNASHTIIASTDFGCRFHPGWLESLISPFSNHEINVVGGAYSVVEGDQLTMSAKAAFIIANGYKTDVYSDSFIPSSRSIAFRKNVYEHIGGYCEWLTLAADDTIFGLELRANKYKIFPVDKPYVYWGRHSTAKGFFKEAFRYGLGDGEAGIHIQTLFKCLAINLISLLFILLIVGSPTLVLNIPVNIKRTYLILIGLLLIIYYIFYIKRWLQYKSSKYDYKVLFFGFLLIQGQKINYIKGYIKGLFFSKPFIKENAKKLKIRLKSI